MSTILWTNVLRPSPTEPARDTVYDLYATHGQVPRTRVFPVRDEALLDLPDPRTYRSLSRAGLLLSAVGLPAAPIMAPFIAADPFSVGMYCAIENGPNDYDSARQMVETSPEGFAAAYKALRSPKHYFKQLANVPPSQLGIFLGIKGPQAVYTHSKHACLHALDQAERDLGDGVVRAALVCSAFSLDDPLLTMRTQRGLAPDVILSEGAACVVLMGDGHYTDWRTMRRCRSRDSYGIAHDLVMLAQRSENDAHRPGTLRGGRRRHSNRHEPQWAVDRPIDSDRRGIGR